MSAKLLCISFFKKDEFIKIYDTTRYLVLFGRKRYGAIYHWISYPINEKSGITWSVNHSSTRIGIDSYSSLL